MKAQATLPLTQDVVLIGGGHAHALVLRMWGMTPLPGARLTVIDPAPEAAYSGMLPGHVAGHYPREALMIDLVRLARFAGARLILGRVEGIDRDARRIHVPGRAPIRYDLASIDIGVTSEMPQLPGFAEHAVPVKPLAPFAAAWEKHLDDVAKGGAAEAVVIGGGVAGAEVAMAMAHRLGPGKVTLVEASAQAMPGLSDGARRAILSAARDLGVTVRLGAAVTAVAAGEVVLADGSRLPSGFTVGAAGAQPQGWLAQTGLDLTNGYVTVGPTLASVSDPGVFAAGDCAHLSHAPRPKAGVFAVRAAPVLFHNLRAALTDTRPMTFRPQHDYLKLVSLGAKRAVADRSGLRLAGHWMWRWKEHIDRRFMERLSDLAPMRPELPELAARGAHAEAGGQPLCGGCAAKVAQGALGAALTGLPRPSRADVLTGRGDDAAVLGFGTTRQVLSTDTLRAFTEDPWLLARIAAVHALGDVWAKGAAPQAALALVTLPRMAASLQAATLAEIMAAASEVFAAEGADIVGGHSALGAEMALGFTVTGLTQAPRPIGQDGAEPGDVLILTKPLGTGVIMAAEMVLKARGAEVAAALASMARPQGAAARLLAPHARAMTDVTGFGLAGHLLGILDASGLGARLDLGALPVLAGAERLLAAGTRSSLHGANAEIRARCALPGGPRSELLFDPQTAGGLLAAVPAGEAAALVRALRDEGFEAAAIGALEMGPPAIAAD